MHKECGTVTEIRGKEVKVESAPDAACASCAARNSCMTGAQQRTKSIWIENSLDARIGDTVFYSIEEKGVVLGANLHYLVPAVFLIAGIILGPKIPFLQGMDTEAAAALGGLISFIPSFVIIGLVSWFLNKRNILAPRLLEIEQRASETSSTE